MAKKDTATEESAQTIEMEPEQTQVEKIKRIYIGPSIPRSDLCNARILGGTAEDINNFISAYSEGYPEVKHLLVTPEELPEALKKVQKKGNILHKYYQDMAAKAVVSRKKV
jgi:hypothetical protein